jgi:hypothetical protein
MAQNYPGSQYPQPTGAWNPQAPVYVQAAPQPPRHWFKTFAISSLLLLIPFVGGAMSIIYIYDRDHPERYDAGRAVAAALLQLLYLIVIAVVVIAAVVALGGLDSIATEMQRTR